MYMYILCLHEAITRIKSKEEADKVKRGYMHI